MAPKLSLKICHLYPDLMDTYGDSGNIITLKKRCQWRGIKTNVSAKSIGDDLKGDFDFFFFGGGQDKTQLIVAYDLQKKKSSIKTAVENSAVLLSVCGGYQLLQNYFKTKDGEIIKGIGLFDAHTEGSNDRMIQNILIEINDDLQSDIKSTYPCHTKPSLRGVNRRSNLNIIEDRHASLAMTNCIKNLIGFENHSGKTYLGKGVKPLGTVIKGSGNNGDDKTEGAIYKNAFGCYLHGSLLPKNPHFADFLIAKALERRYGKINLKTLDDSFEWQAHNQSIKITRSRG